MNSPLMDVSMSVDAKECASVIEELVELFNDEQVRSDALRTVVYRAKHLAERRRSAELNLAIATGIEIVFPSHVLNPEYAGSFRADARQCPDFCPDLELKYLQLQLSGLLQRAGRSSAAIDHRLRAKYQLAAERTERELTRFREAEARRERTTPPQLAAS